jgi:CRP/FNR family cyclic AMP-dependent transcriptional regulator
MPGKKQRTPLDLFKGINAPITARDYRNKQAIFSQGDKADALFYIRAGYVKLTAASKSGKKAVIAILCQGDFFGEGCVTKQSLRVATATAIDDITIARVMRADLVRIIHHEPDFARLFIAHLLTRIGRIEEEFLDQIFNSSEKRLARILLLMSGVGLHAETEPALFKVSQQTLAEMVGTTRSRVSHFMNSFRSRGFIEYKGRVRILPGLLTFLAGD